MNETQGPSSWQLECYDLRHKLEKAEQMIFAYGDFYNNCTNLKIQNLESSIQELLHENIALRTTLKKFWKPKRLRLKKKPI